MSVPPSIPIRAALGCLALLLGWIVPCPGATSSLLDRYHITPIGEGLPQNTVKAILQGSDGYVWLGTRFGLVRYDGVQLKTYDRASHPEMEDDNCGALVEDLLDRRLWICRGRSVTSFKDGTFRNHALMPRPSGDSMHRFVAARDGGLWISSDAGLLRFQDGRVVRQWTPTNGLAGSKVWGLHLDEEDRLWVGSDNAVQYLHPASGHFIDLPRPDGTHFGPVRHINRIRDLLWIGADTGLHVHDLATGAWRSFNRTNSPLRHDVWSVTPDSHGQHWIVTLAGPLYCLKDWQWQPLPPSNPWVREAACVLEDREHNLWIGSQRFAAARLRRHHVHALGEPDGMLNENVWSIHEARDGTVWFACDAVLSRLRDGRVDSFPFATDDGKNEMQSVLEDHEGLLWVGTRKTGLQQFRDGRWTAVPLPSAPPDPVVLSLFEDRRRRLWVGTQKDLFVRTNGTFTRFQTSTGSGIRDVAGIVEDRGGALWFASLTDGIHRVHENHTVRFGKGDGLPSDTFWAILEDRGGTLWFGSPDGLVRFHEGRFATLTSRHGLPDTVINSILEDDYDSYWISSNRGIFQIPRAGLQRLADGDTNSLDYVSYGTSDGMPDRETNGGQQPAAIRARDGSLWFPTVKGAVRIVPADIRKNVLPPPVVIEEIMADGQVMNLGGDRRLPPGSGRVVEIRYTANSFAAPEKVRFRYRLDGWDTDWIDAGGRRVAFYTNLRPGHYRFLVAACNNHGVWSEPRAIAFSIAPRFHETGLFYALCILGVTTAGFGLHRLRLRVVTRIHDLENRNALERERARIAQEMHDDLGGSLTEIGLLAELATREPGLPAAVEGRLQSIRQTTGELFRGLDQIVWSLNPRHDTVASLVDYICKHGAYYVRLAGARLRLDVAEDLPDHPLSSEQRHHLFLATKEILHNAVKHSGAGELRFRAAVSHRILVLEFRDYGRGFDPAAADRTRSGLGNIERRLRLVGGEFRLSSRPGGGTRARLLLPLGPGADLHAILEPRASGPSDSDTTLFP